jgi:hypothetical protein
VGTARSRRWHWQGCNDGEQRRRAVRADGSAARQGEERPARSGERRRGAGAARGAQRGAAGQLRLSTWSARAAGVSSTAKTEQSRAEGLEVDEGTNS